MQFTDDYRIIIDPPERPKKMTATRFACALGLNPWETPFSTWCEITRTYSKPFEDTIYTIAGKKIEPIVIDYLNRIYSYQIKDPKQVYGPNYFQQTKGDFFKNEKVFGGMWDAIGQDYVVEIKTSKRSEDWEEDIPIYYKLQASLYAFLLGIDKVIVSVSFLDEKDYLFPESFKPNASNTKIYRFNLSEEYPDFVESYIKPALDWWNRYVLTGESPYYDENERTDASIINELTTNRIHVTDDTFLSYLEEAESLQNEMDQLKDTEKRLKEIKDQIKQYMTGNLGEKDRKVEILNRNILWSLTKSNTTRVDTNALKRSGLYDQFIKTIETITLKNKKMGE